MEVPHGNLKRLINCPSIALATWHQGLKSKSQPHWGHLVQWTVHLWLGLNFDLSFLHGRGWFLLYIYLFFYHQIHFLSLVSLESRAWGKGSCATILLGRVHQGSGVKDKGSKAEKEIEPIQGSTQHTSTQTSCVLSWRPLSTTDCLISQDHLPWSHVNNVSAMYL